MNSAAATSTATVFERAVLATGPWWAMVRGASRRSRRADLARVAALCLTAVAGMTFAAPGESSAQGTSFLLETGLRPRFGVSCQATPRPIVSDAVAVSVGLFEYFGLALRSDGTVAAWGDEEQDVVAGVDPDVCAGAFYLSDAEAAAQCPSVCASQGHAFNGSWTNVDAEVHAAGCVGGQEAVCGCKQINVVQISAGRRDALALREDGTLFRWGQCSSISTASGNCSHLYTPMPEGLSDVIAMDNDLNSIALKSDGTIATWGVVNTVHTDECFPKPRWPGSSCHSPPPGLSGVVDVAANGSHFAAVKADGTVVVWGNYTQVSPHRTHSPEVPPELNHDIVKVRLSNRFNMALRSDGTVFTWNSCVYNCSHLSPPTPPADLDDVVDIGFYGDSGGMALKSDGTVVRWGPPVYSVCAAEYPHAIDYDICAGESYAGDAHAQASCPAVCAFRLLQFNGNWTNDHAAVSAAGCDAGQEAICGCSIGNVRAMATRKNGPGPSALFIVARDLDGDGVPDDRDAFPHDPTEWADTDGDGVGDNGDAFPDDSTESADTDGDGVGDNGDAFPDDPTETADTDGDGVGDNGDNCPDTPNSDQADLDGDIAGDVCDDEDAQFELDRATVWRTRSKLGRIILEGAIPSGIHGAEDLFSTDAGFSVRVIDAHALDKTSVFAPEDCETLSPRVKRCRLPDRSSWVKLKPVEGKAGDVVFKADLRRLDIGSPQLGAVQVTIRHGDIDRVGVNATCRVYNSKLVCRD